MVFAHDVNDFEDLDEKSMIPYFSNSLVRKLSIPPVSGLLVSPWWEKNLNATLWIGRMQHSVIAIRSQWAPVYEVQGILSKNGCNAIISDAEGYATSRMHNGSNGWLTDRHPDHATTDLPASAIYPDNRLNNYLTKYLLPSLADRYRLKAADFYIADLFIVKYAGSSGNGNSGQSFLKAHRDRSPFSFVVALNDDFTGGGTFFPEFNELWKPSVGGAVLFHGQHSHGGAEVNSGTRYIVTGFVEYKNDSHSSFMGNYLEDFDGTAAKHGFRQDDIIRGIEMCIKGDGEGRIRRRMVVVTDLSPKEWQEVATSCELLDHPTASTVLVVERRSSIERPERRVSDEDL
eukprot:gene32177-41714_t